MFIFQMIWKICKAWTTKDHARINTRKVFNIFQQSRFFYGVESPCNMLSNNIMSEIRVESRPPSLSLAELSKRATYFSSLV